MMDGSLIEVLGPGRPPRPVWVGFTDYATALFLRGDGGAWSDTHRALWWIQQAQSLLRSSVIEVPLGVVMADWLLHNPGSVEATGQVSAKKTARAILAVDKPKRALVSLLGALTGAYRGSPPIVLRVPSPRGWLGLAGSHLGHAAADEVDDEEAVAVYLADCLRSFAECGLSGILIDARDEPAATLAGLMDRCEPVANLARHYRWALGLQVGLPMRDADSRMDFLIGPADALASPQTIARGWELPMDAWQPTARPDVPGTASFVFAPVPGDAVPEQVLATLALLRND